MRVRDGGVLESPVAKFLSESEQLGLVDALGAVSGDLILIVAGKRSMVRDVLGALRLDLGRPPVTEGGLHFLWVVDFPLFEDDGEGNATPMHHPFTMPHPDDIDRLESDPLSVRAAGLRPRAQRLGARFGLGAYPSPRRAAAHLLGDRHRSRRRADNASGSCSTRSASARRRTRASPSASTGSSRSSCGEENIREVIAFPKTQSGVDPLTGAPSPSTPANSATSASASSTKNPPNPLPPNRGQSSTATVRNPPTVGTLTHRCGT